MAAERAGRTTIGDDWDSVLAAAGAGAEWAIAVLYRELNPPLVRYLRTRVPRDAEDLASEVWMALAPALAGFTGTEQELRRLAFTIAHRRVADYWRRRARRVDEEVTAPDALPESPAHERARDVADLVAAADSAEAALALVRARLPAAQADVVLLRVVAGLDAEEVAEILGKRPGTVRVLQHRALKTLARALATEPAADDVVPVMPVSPTIASRASAV